MKQGRWASGSIYSLQSPPWTNLSYMYVWILQIPSWTNLTQRHVWLWVFFTSLNILTMMAWLWRRLDVMIQSIQNHPQMNVFSTYLWLWVFLCGIFSFSFSFVMFWCKLTLERRYLIWIDPFKTLSYNYLIWMKSISLKSFPWNIRNIPFCKFIENY